MSTATTKDFIPGRRHVSEGLQWNGFYRSQIVQDMKMLSFLMFSFFSSAMTLSRLLIIIERCNWAIVFHFLCMGITLLFFHAPGHSLSLKNWLEIFVRGFPSSFAHRWNKRGLIKFWPVVLDLWEVDSVASFSDVGGGSKGSVYLATEMVILLKKDWTKT